MTAARRSVEDIVLVPRLAEQDAVSIIAALERQAREYDASADGLPASQESLAARDRAAAERCRALADRLQRLRTAMRKRS